MSDPAVLNVTVINQRREIARLAELFDERAAEWGLTEDDRCHVNLMLDEFVSNVIKYGYSDTKEHEIQVTVEKTGDTLDIRIEDDGRPFNPIEAKPPNLDLPIEQRPIGGLGIFIAKELASSIAYTREHDRNILTLTRKLQSE